MRNLLALVGRSDERPRSRPLRVSVSGADDGVRRLVLQKADGTYLVALWRLDSVWETQRRRGDGVRVDLAGRPVVLHVTPKG